KTSAPSPKQVSSRKFCLNGNSSTATVVGGVFRDCRHGRARWYAVKADWQTPGAATGELRCTLTLPAIDERRDFKESSFDRIRVLLRRYLPTAASAIDGATFVISAEVRAPKRGARWRPLARWRAPQAIEPVLERAARAFKDLPRERGRRPLGL